MTKILLAVIFFAAGAAHAGVPYWLAPQASTHTAYGTGYLSGVLKVYPSTSTAAASPAITIDGITGAITASLTGNASLNLPLTGGTLTGPLTLAGSSLTVTGSAFSVGTSTFVVTGGKVGVGTANPSTPLNTSITLTSNYAASLSATQSLTNSPIRIDNLGTGNTNVGLVMFAGDTNSAVTLLSTIKTASTAGDLAISLRDASSSINEKMRVTSTGLVGIGTTSPASKLQIGTSLNGTTDYMQIDTLAADTAGPPAATDCDAATEVGRQIMATRYTATAEHRIWFCTQTGASAYGWKYLELQTP